jgi:hypothetical protein
MCIMCRKRKAPQELDFCPACSLIARLEVARGLRRFEQYLAIHALFSAWDDRLRADDSIP